MKEVNVFETWMNRVVEGTWALPDTPEQEARLQELMSQELIAGPDGTNAKEQLYDLVGDDHLFDLINSAAAADPNSNIWDNAEIVGRLGELGVDTAAITQRGAEQTPEPAQGVAEGLDPDIFEELEPRFIANVAKKVMPTVRAKATEEGYAHLTTADGLNLVIGCSIADGDISINIGSDPMSTTSSGQNKGAVTSIIKAVYDAAVKKYGQPKSGSLSVDYDAGHGVWQHIANKLGLEYGAHSVKEQGVSEGIVDTIRAANYDRLANRSAKQAAQWALASRGGKRSPTQVALGAKSAERAKKAAELRGQASGDEPDSLREVDRRGFLKGLGAAALGAAALGAGAQTMPNMDAPKQIELAQRYYKALVQRAREDGEELDTRTLNRLKAKATDAAARKFQENPRQPVPQQQNDLPSQGSERKVARDIGDFRESQDVAESRMADVDAIVQSIIAGDMDPYDVMNHPQGPEEEYVAQILQKEYENVAIEHRLHPDDDFEQILDRVVDRLAQDYGHEMDEADTINSFGECGTVAGGMAPVQSSLEEEDQWGQAPQDPMNYNAAITGSYYESDDPLARLKTLALSK